MQQLYQTTIMGDYSPSDHFHKEIGNVVFPEKLSPDKFVSFNMSNHRLTDIVGYVVKAEDNKVGIKIVDQLHPADVDELIAQHVLQE